MDRFAPKTLSMKETKQYTLVSWCLQGTFCLRFHRLFLRYKLRLKIYFRDVIFMNKSAVCPLRVEY